MLIAISTNLRQVKEELSEEFYFDDLLACYKASNESEYKMVQLVCIKSAGCPSRLSRCCEADLMLAGCTCRLIRR